MPYPGLGFEGLGCLDIGGGDYLESLRGFMTHSVSASGYLVLRVGSVKKRKKYTKQGGE